MIKDLLGEDVYQSLFGPGGDFEGFFIKDYLLNGYTTGTSLVIDGLKKTAQHIIKYGKTYGYDQDSDHDGIMDNSDPFPNDPLEWIDSDGDGIGNNSDEFPYDFYNGTQVIIVGSTTDNLTPYVSKIFKKGGTGEIPITVLSASKKFLELVQANTITLPHTIFSSGSPQYPITINGNI